MNRIRSAFSLLEILVLICIVSLLMTLLMPTKLRAQDFGTDANKTIQDFKTGPLTNLNFLAGPNYNTADHKWGAEGLLAYNLPAASTLPFNPWIMPIVGIYEQGNDWTGVSGTVSFNARIHPLSFAGPTNSIWGKAFFDVGGIGGVGKDISGEQFGPIKIPGNSNGKGTAAITGESLSTAFKINKALTFELWIAETDWTTRSGHDIAGGLGLKFTPKRS